MKKLVLTLVALLAFGGSIFAQDYESHWADFNYNIYKLNAQLVTFVQIDGEYVDAAGNWADLELAAFVGDACRGHEFMADYTLVYGDPYPCSEPMLYYTNADEALSFKLYDHAQDILYEDFQVFVMGTGEPTTILTGETHVEIWNGYYDEGIVINFTTPVPTQTFTLDITGYGTEFPGYGYYADPDAGGYYLIASPVMEDITPTAENGFIADPEDYYDLYWFNQAVYGHQWRNYKASHFDLTNGKGYLYASMEGTTLSFTGTPYDGDGVIPLEYESTVPEFAGWNLVGNPFPVAATISREEFYVMNDEGSELTAGSGAIPAMHGVFVLAQGEGENVTFTPADDSKATPSLNLNLVQGRGLVDRAVIRFTEGRMLPKFQMNPNHTKVYIPQEGNDYAVVRAGEMGEMPVNFKAEKNGSYTLSFTAEEVSFGYLHLIDNKTGNDVDLLATPIYTFNALTTDYASRFKLVFATGNNGNDDNFAFFSNGSFIINNEGEAMLQVVDVNGRILKSESINGCTSVNFKAAAGIYMIRLMNGDNVKVQKVVVK